MAPGSDEVDTSQAPTARRRLRDPDDKRQRILSAARSLFDAQGFDGTTTQEIARLAGVSEGIVFHHFGSKHGLLVQLTAGWGQGLAAVVARGADHAAATSVETVIRGVFAYARAHGLLRQTLAMAGGPEHWNRSFQSGREEVIAAIAAVIRRDQQGGRGRPANVEIAAQLVYGMVETALRDCFVRDEGRHEDAYVRETVACIEGALATRLS